MGENNRTKKKPPKYVIVYNMILEKIQDGTYPQGGRLPSEPDLAVLLNVSRVTLRQALKILAEDGIVENRQGVGNFVRKSLSQEPLGLEKIENPIYRCCNEKIAKVQLAYGLESSDKYRSYFNYILKKESPIALCADRSYYNEQEELVSFCTSIMNIDIFSRISADIKSNEEVLGLIEEKIYSLAHRVKLEIKCLQEKEWVRHDKIEWDSQLIFVIFEDVYDEKGDVLLNNKFYLPGEKINFVVNIYN